MSKQERVGRPALIKSYKRRDIVGIALGLIYGAWPHVCKRADINSSCTEPEIAGALYHELWRERRRRKLEGPPYISDEGASRSTPGRLIPDGWIDFKLIYDFDYEDAFLSVECKRVSSKDTHLANEYVKEGVVRFTSGKYAKKHDWAAMLSFVIDGDLDGSAKLIHSRLTKDPTETYIIGMWVIETGFGTHSNLYRSRHLPPHKKRVYLNILHIFLNF